jgi:putative tricarboxylic transport membrane protein
MELFDNLAYGFSVAVSLDNILWCLFGVTIGTFIGVLPGVGALAAISMLLPVTFYLTPTAALIMLAGIYYGANYGGSTASILLNLPGTPAAAVVCMDGYAMTRQGRAGVALFMTTIASFIGGSISIVLMTVAAPPIAQLALKFTSPEFFSMMLLGLIAASTLASGSPLKGMAMVVFGLMLGTVGTDLTTGLNRFTFGNLELSKGLNLIAIGMGMFGVSEVLFNIGKPSHTLARSERVSLQSLMPTREDWRRSWMPILRGSAVGALFGALPGTGSTISSFMAYAVEKRSSKNPEKFGSGAIEGITAPEAANNSSVQAAFIPTLTLGIPGDVVMAFMLGALILHGVVPGPTLLTEHREIFWGLAASFWIGNLLLLVLNIPLIGIWVKMLQIPYYLLSTGVLFFICIGVYSTNSSPFDLFLVIFFGLVGYFMRVLGFPAAPVLLGFMLGPMIEEELRRALVISRGSFAIFIEHRISAFFLLLSLAMILWSVRGAFLRVVLRRRSIGRP